MTTEPTQSDDSPGYSRVSPDKASAIIRLRRANPKITGLEIAAALEIHPSTVSRWLQILETDTVPEARKLLKANALRASMKVADQIDHNDPRVSQGAAKAVLAGAGVAEQGVAVQVGVRVIVGSLDKPAGPDPFIDAKDTGETTYKVSD